jgi:hypothetical protein
MDTAAMIHATIAPAPGRRDGGVLHLAVPLTPYGVECIVDGALGGGGVAVELPVGISDAALARVVAMVSVLRRWGLGVQISGGVAEGTVGLPPDHLPGQASG